MGGGAGKMGGAADDTAVAAGSLGPERSPSCPPSLARSLSLSTALCVVVGCGSRVSSWTRMECGIGCLAAEFSLPKDFSRVREGTRHWARLQGKQ